MTARRDRAAIYAEILQVIEENVGQGDPPPVTRVQLKVNVPFPRFQEYLDDMREKGLVVREPGLELTETGRRFLEEYRRVRTFLATFGLLRDGRGFA